MRRIPRIGYADLPPALQRRLQERVERLGYLGEFFQVAAHQPEALCHFIDYTEALKSALEPRLVEVIALTVAAATGNDYERVQHERLALKVGLDVDEVGALTSREPTAACFSNTERAAIRLAEQVVAARGGTCEEAFDSLLALTDHEVTIACLMTATRYLAHATMANTWRLRVPVSSPQALEAARV